MKNKRALKIITNLTTDNFDLFLSRLGDSILDLTYHNFKKDVVNKTDSSESIVNVYPITFRKYILYK